MNSLNISPTRAPRGSRTADGSAFIEYEVRRGDASKDTQFASSLDGRRVVRDANISHAKRRRVQPSDLQDPLGTWVPLRDEEGTMLEGSEMLEGEAGDKRKRYESADEPMKQWRPLMGMFLDELLRGEGVGSVGGADRCRCCEVELGAQARRFRCRQCGVFMQPHCAIWGFACPHPAAQTRTLVVLDFPHVHTVNFKYCACDNSDDASNLQQLLRNRWYPATTVDPGTCATFATLEAFRLLNVVSNVNVQDFVKTMERRSDATRVGSIPDRYKAFGLMSRQWAFLKRLKRAGRGHDERGAAGTERGELGVLCWACPHDGKNLPSDWRDVAPEFQFLFMLILAIDANFRLRHRLRPNERDDPPLGAGWGYMVESGPYKKHLRNYVEEKDVSSCVAFQALMKKDTRITTGLRASGVGGVVCARHEVVRPQGMGDLQKGERYSNMDYIVLASILGITLLLLAFSYDVACQWRVHFKDRMEKLPRKLRLNMAEITLLFALPVWHATAHEKTCQVQNSLTYVKGVGRTDGEGIERTWSRLNPIAWASRVMSWGGREDAIEDKVDHENFEKNVGLVTTLPRKLMVAIDERDTQVAAFAQVDATLEDDVRAEWEGMIIAWQGDRERKNPYESKGDHRGVSESAIRLQLAKEELEEAAGGSTRLHGTSVSSFLVLGLQLEQLQFRIRREIAQRSLLVSDQTERVAELRRGFFVKLRKFRRLQGVHMPAAVEQVAEDEERRDSDSVAPQAEDVEIYLPSGLSPARRAECGADLIEKETRLRVGQLGDWVAKLRRGLLSRRHMWDWREQNVGQRAGTRAATLVERVQRNIDEAAKRYRASHKALMALGGEAACENWPTLKDEDLRVDEDHESDVAGRRKLNNVGRVGKESRKSRRAGRPNSTKRVMSWIWTSGGGPDEDDEELREAVRIEWSRARARRDRWVEEVMHLREEMRRTLRFLQWKALWWEERLLVQREVRGDIMAGVQAYAARQAAGMREIARRFKGAWDGSVSEAVRAAVEEERDLPSATDMDRGCLRPMAIYSGVARAGASLATTRTNSGTVAFASAPFSKRNLTTSTFPAWIANPNGVP
ncbi:CxC2 domain-containing protein [Favolaschia claudopus]|uniref:CxC2 domain-containing protein n=1 Tax=Favolaschia claudopus TaxID=2862362 RepID=A0AAW0BQK7_9AGAR